MKTSEAGLCQIWKDEQNIYCNGGRAVTRLQTNIYRIHLFWFENQQGSNFQDTQVKLRVVISGIRTSRAAFTSLHYRSLRRTCFYASIVVYDQKNNKGISILN